MKMLQIASIITRKTLIYFYNLDKIIEQVVTA